MSNGFNPINTWRTGDLISASKLNAMLDNIDVLVGFDEQRMIPFDAGANLLACETNGLPGIYGRPGMVGSQATSAFNKGNQVEYYVAHNGNQLVIKHSSDDSAYVFWNWDGVSFTNPDPIALVPTGVETTLTLSATQLSGLYQYQPVRVMLRSQNHPTATLFVDYIYQTSSTAPTIASLPIFENGTTSSAADLNAIVEQTDNGKANLYQPIPCQYSNDDRIGDRNGVIAYVRHTHDKFAFDLTAVSQGWTANEENYVFLRLNDTHVWSWGVTEAQRSYDRPETVAVPAGISIGDWYMVHFGWQRATEHEQRLTLWSYGEQPDAANSAIDELPRWQHGDTVQGDSTAPYLLQMADTLNDVAADLRWINLPCRVAGSVKPTVGWDVCAGEQAIDGMSAHRVHRWLAYNTFRKADGSWANAQIHWSMGGRNLQSFTLPTVEVPSFFDLESTPVKPGMWFRMTGVGFAIQTPIPGINYA